MSAAVRAKHLSTQGSSWCWTVDLSMTVVPLFLSCSEENQCFEWCGRVLIDDIMVHFQALCAQNMALRHQQGAGQSLLLSRFNNKCSQLLLCFYESDILRTYHRFYKKDLFCPIAIIYLFVLLHSIFCTFSFHNEHQREFLALTLCMNKLHISVWQP